MAVKRRMGAESSEIRAQLVEAAAQLLREEGGAAITARRISEKVGLKRHIVHYYFGTIEELIVAVLQRDEARALEGYETALQSSEPLRVIRKLGVDASVRVYEIAALAYRHEAIRAQFVKSMETFRRIQTEALTRYLALRGLQSNVPPVVVTTLMQVISQIMAAEASLGATEGHDEINAYIDRWLESFERCGLSPAVHD